MDKNRRIFAIAAVALVTVLAIAVVVHQVQRAARIDRMAQDFEVALERDASNAAASAAAFDEAAAVRECRRLNELDRLGDGYSNYTYGEVSTTEVSDDFYVLSGQASATNMGGNPVAVGYSCSAALVEGEWEVELV